MVREMQDEENGRLPVAVLIPKRNLEHVRRLLCEEFNDRELLNIAIAVGVDPRMLSAPVCRGQARTLLELVQEYGLLADLLAECREARPFANWPNLN